MARLVRTTVQPSPSYFEDDRLKISLTLNGEGYASGDEVVLAPAAMWDVMVGLLDTLSANAATDDDGYCFFCVDMTWSDEFEDSEHHPECPLERARAFLASVKP